MRPGTSIPWAIWVTYFLLNSWNLKVQQRGKPLNNLYSYKYCTLKVTASNKPSKYISFKWLPIHDGWVIKMSSWLIGLELESDYSVAVKVSWSVVGVSEVQYWRQSDMMLLELHFKTAKCNTLLLCE